MLSVRWSYVILGILSDSPCDGNLLASHPSYTYTEGMQSDTLRFRTPLAQPRFLPMSRAEMHAIGWDALDVLLISGDAYVDHPTFAAALLGRWLVAHGYRTGIVAQPRWNTPEDVLCMGRPRLFAGIAAGAIDSMLAHYTAFRKKRHDDAYTPGGKAGARPNRAVIVYTNLLRQAFAGLPVVIGGIEASLRRATHYDFWTDSLRRSILLDAKADLLVYGMGEYALREAAARYDAAMNEGGAATAAEALHGIGGTAWVGTESDMPEGASIMRLPSHEDISADVRLLMEATLQQERHVHRGDAWAIQPVGNRAVIMAPPAPPMSPEDLDRLYALPFTREAHPSYRETVPAADMIRTSITTHRGCGGGCSFCSLALHQGRRIASRSRDSVLAEARDLAAAARKGVSISDVGGPSANMWQARCTLNPAKCRRASCMFPSVCKGFAVDQRKAVRLLWEVRDTPGVRNVRVASGVRFDLALREGEALRAYTMEFTGGQLKVAPEHICDEVLEYMRKPGLPVFEKFLEAFAAFSDEAGKEQYVVPYLLSAFPGCTDDHMRTLSRWLQARGWSPQQVQCFIPTPGTVATAMYAAGIDPEGNPIPVARTDAERLRQHGILMPDTGRPPSRDADNRRRGDARQSETGRGKAGTRDGRPHRSDRDTGNANRHDGGRSDRRGGRRDEDRPDRGRRNGARPDGGANRGGADAEERREGRKGGSKRPPRR
ncbi:UPF0313 protein [Desulfovibrio desulfuricans]|nr:UPF0313 protein [Desulfovibrio desulfuricans]